MTVPLVLADEHEELQKSVRRFLTDCSPMTEVRRLTDAEEDYDPGFWRQMATELGLQGIAIPEEHGGSGAGTVELSVVFEEMGRALACSPFFATVALAVPTILAADDPTASTDFLPGIASGDTIATVALVGDDDQWTPDGVSIRAEAVVDGFRLTGSRSFVPDGDVANLLLVVADSGEGPTLFAVDGDAPGMSRRRLQTLDLTRRLATVDFDVTPARQVGAPGGGWAAVAQALDVAAIALASECTGGAQQCLEMATGYARERVQFGRVIGSFQAIKHLCADMLVDVEGAKAAASYASWAASEDWSDRDAAAAVAKVFCTEAYSAVAAENIQVHGGIGFTWEHDAHLHFRRAKSAELLLGGDRHRRLLEQYIGFSEGE